MSIQEINTNIIGSIEITAVSGSDIKVKSFSKPNLYVVFEVGNQKQKSSEKSGKNPKWNEVFNFDILEDSILKISVYNGKSNEIVGGMECILKDIIYKDQKNHKFKIYNEKKQEKKGEIHLLINFHKKIPPPQNYYGATPSNTNYMRTEMDNEVLPRTDGDIINKNYASRYIKEDFAGQSKHMSMSQITSNNPYLLTKNNSAGGTPSNQNQNQNLLPKLKIYNNGRPGRMTPNSNQRHSPMVYDNDLYHNQFSPLTKQSPVTKTPTKEGLYHYRSDDSLKLKKTPNIIDNNMVFSQPSYSYLNSQSDDEFEIYSSSLLPMTFLVLLLLLLVYLIFS